MADKKKNFFYSNNRLQQLRAFYHTVRLQNITQAAKEVGVTQPALSLQIKALERDFGAKLLSRNLKKNFLTKEGEEFCKTVFPVLQDFEMVAKNFSLEKPKTKRVCIKIAIHHAAISFIMPKAIAIFKKIHPKTKIILQNIAPDEAMSRLKNDETDLILFPFYDPIPEIELVEIASYKPILIMRRDHPLAISGIEMLSDLKREDFIRIDKNLIVLPFFEAAFKIYNLAGSLEFENGNWEMLKKLVKENNFIALVSTICLDENDKDLDFLDMSNFFPDMQYKIALKPNCLKDSVVKDLIDSVKSSVS